MVLSQIHTKDVSESITGMGVFQADLATPRFVTSHRVLEYRLHCQKPLSSLPKAGGLGKLNAALSFLPGQSSQKATRTSRHSNDTDCEHVHAADEGCLSNKRCTINILHRRFPDTSARTGSYSRPYSFLNSQASHFLSHYGFVFHDAHNRRSLHHCKPASS